MWLSTEVESKLGHGRREPTGGAFMTLYFQSFMYSFALAFFVSCANLPMCCGVQRCSRKVGRRPVYLATVACLSSQSSVTMRCPESRRSASWFMQGQSCCVQCGVDDFSRLPCIGRDGRFLAMPQSLAKVDRALYVSIVGHR
jgi:hypothetical protein